LLPWDQLAIWAITVGSNMAKATPGLGTEGPGFQLFNTSGYELITNASDAKFLLLGGRFVGEATLNRFYILHCVAIPLVVSGLIAIHFWRVRKDGGISQPL
jgi:quinol-cytochrome oxidoreductase complex cytochrome b subunit